MRKEAPTTCRVCGATWNTATDACFTRDHGQCIICTEPEASISTKLGIIIGVAHRECIEYQNEAAKQFPSLFDRAIDLEHEFEKARGDFGPE